MIKWLPFITHLACQCLYHLGLLSSSCLQSLNPLTESPYLRQFLVQTVLSLALLFLQSKNFIFVDSLIFRECFFKSDYLLVELTVSFLVEKRLGLCILLTLNFKLTHFELILLFNFLYPFVPLFVLLLFNLLLEVLELDLQIIHFSFFEL